MFRYTLFSLIVILFTGIACSNGSINPVEAGLNSYDIPVLDFDSDLSNRSLLGVWDVTFDIDNLTAEVTQSRELSAHFNVTSLLPSPSIHVNSWDPSMQVIDADVTITNPHAITAYDVRMIGFTNNIGHKLLNADNWTALYDIPGGLPINPFKAFAKSIAQRAFGAQTRHTENFQVFLPNGDKNVTFAIDASYPTNCAEPYLITKFVQINTIYDVVGSTGRIEVEMYDWQNDISQVYFYCPVLTGVTLQPMNSYVGNLWGMNLSNNTGASAGQYQAVILASSMGSPWIYHWVTVTITQQ